MSTRSIQPLWHNKDIYLRILKIVSVAIFLASQATWLAVILLDPSNRLTDFHIYDVFGQAIREGYDPYALHIQDANRIVAERWGLTWRQLALPDPVADTLALHYSPPVQLLFSALANLSPLRGAMVWTLASFVAYTLSVLVISRMVLEHWIEPMLLVLASVLIPAFQVVSGGQVGMFMLLGMSLALWGWRKDIPWLTGLGASVALMFKPLPVVMAFVGFVLIQEPGT